MRTLPRRLRKDAVTVQAVSGQGAFGPILAKSVTVLGKVSMTRQLVRDAQGDEVVSEMTIYLDPADAAAFTADAHVSVDGYESRVISSAEQARPGEPVLTKVMCR